MPNARLLASFLNGSWRRECPPLSLTPAEVARATPLLIGSGAAALGWRRIKDTPALKGCAEAQELCQSGQILALEDARLDGALEFVATRLNEAGIVPLIAKGWAVGHFYSSRYLRAYGDFDLCAPAGRCELARATLLRLTLARSPESDMDDIFVDCGPRSRAVSHRIESIQGIPKSILLSFTRGAWWAKEAATMALSDDLRKRVVPA